MVTVLHQSVIAGLVMMGLLIAGITTTIMTGADSVMTVTGVMAVTGTSTIMNGAAWVMAADKTQVMAADKTQVMAADKTQVLHQIRHHGRRKRDERSASRDVNRYLGESERASEGTPRTPRESLVSPVPPSGVCAPSCHHGAWDN
jgi:hypothetical protein